MSLKEKTVNGVKWSILEAFGTFGVAILVQLIIARVLPPSDFGIIGMIYIFIAISTCLTVAGFPHALVRKLDRTETDLTTVFISDILLSILFYAALFFTAPAIASFYDIPVLKPLIRVVGLSLIINSTCSVQRTLYSIRIDFRSLSIISIVSGILGGVCGIVLAYSGFGVWSLVYMQLVTALSTSIMVWALSSWRPKRLVFSLKSFRELFSFGSKLMLTQLIETIYRYLFSPVIGKAFGPTQAGYYYQANRLSDIPSQNIANAIKRVTFPVLSQIQDNNDLLRINYTKILKLVSYITFPVMGVLMVVAHPLILILIKEAWLPCVPYLRVLCIAGMLQPILSINLNLLTIKGRSDLLLYLEIIKRAISIAVVVALIPFGVFWMCVGISVSSFIALAINTHFTGRLINIGFLKQMRIVIMPNASLTLIAGAFSYAAVYLLKSPYFQLFAGISIFFAVYLGLSTLLKREEFYELRTILQMEINKLRKK